MINQTDCSGYQTQYIYDDQQRVEQIIDAEGNGTTYYYDDSKPWLEAMVKRVDYPDGNSIEMRYDEIGQLIDKHDDTLGITTSTHYEVDGLVTKQIDASGNSIAYAYDDYRRLSQLTNENSEAWIFEYDKGDNLISETRFDGHQSRYRFDALGNLISQTDNPHLPSNQQRRISYERDLIGQILTQTSISAEQSVQVQYEYDKAGKLLNATNPHSRIDLAYDANGQLIKERQTSTLNIAGLQHEYSLALQHDYDELGNRTATTLPDGKVINQLYYGSGHLYNQSLYDPSTDQHIEIRHSERNKLHVEVNRQQGILDSVYTHDPMGRLINQNSSYNDHIVVRRAYQYDTIGQLTDINSQASLIGKDNTVQQHTRNHHYQYDAIGRLTQHKLAGSNTNIIEQFAFDPAGNRASAHSSRVDETNKQTQTAKHKPQGRPTELISQGKRVRYTYDNDGRVVHKTIAANTHQSNNNLIQFKKELTFKYNANNELSQTILTHHKGSDTIVTMTDYYYDAFGRRIHKHSQISQGSNTQQKQKQKHTHMLWDGDKAIQEHTDTHVYNTIYDQGSFTPIARMVWLKDGLQQAANDDSDNVASNHDGNSIQVYHYHNDQLGTPNELTNEQGEVVWLADYEAWGNTAKVVWNEQVIEQMQVSAEELQPIRFQGQHFDVETGLHYNRFRYYDADLGMFTSRDPIDLMGGSNVFAYAPNPIGWVDPLGLTMYTLDDAHQDLRAGVNSKIQPVYTTMSGKKTYSKEDIYDRWKTVEDAHQAKMLRTGKMSPCPSSPPTSCTSCAEGSGGWKKYGGNSNVFHCGFRGFLENRVPSEENPAPANECFYDNSGALVDENHKWKGCRGTPDYYPYFGTGTDADEDRSSPHATKDTGGTLGPSKTHANLAVEALAESVKYHASTVSETVSSPPIR